MNILSLPSSIVFEPLIHYLLPSESCPAEVIPDNKDKLTIEAAPKSLLKTYVVACQKDHHVLKKKILQIINTADKLISSLSATSQEKKDELIKISFYLHHFVTDEKNKLLSFYIKKKGINENIGLNHSIFIQKDTMTCFVIPRKNETPFSQIRSSYTIRNGLMIHYATNTIKKISILRNDKHKKLTEKEIKILKIFSGCHGHVKVHQIFTLMYSSKIHCYKGNLSIIPKSYVCTEYYSHSLKSTNELSLTSREIAQICTSTVQALSTAHTCGITHNGITADSIWLKPEYTFQGAPSSRFSAVLSGWELAQDCKDRPLIDSWLYGAIENTAPELLAKSNRELNSETMRSERLHDVYALGLTLLQFILGPDLVFTSSPDNVLKSLRPKQIPGPAHIKHLNHWQDDDLLAISSDFSSHTQKTDSDYVHDSVILQYSVEKMADFHQCFTIGMRLQWLKANRYTLTLKEALDVDHTLSANYEEIYRRAREKITVWPSNEENILLKQVLEAVVEMINPNPIKRPTSTNVAQHLNQILSVPYQDLHFTM